MVPARIAALLCLLTAPLFAQGAADSLAEFRKYFPRFRSVEEQVEAVHTLSGFEDPAVAEQLFELLSHKERAVADAAEQELRGLREPATFVELVEGLPEVGDPEQLRRLIRVLSAAKQRQAMPALRAMVLDAPHRDDSVRAAILSAVAALGVGEVELLVAGLNDKADRVRVAAAASAAALRERAVIESLLGALEDRSWQVQAAVIDALGAIRDPVAIDPLVDMLDEEQGRLVEDCALALERITGKEFGTDAAEWRRALERLRRTSWRIPTDEEIAAMEASRAANATRYADASSNSFSGISTHSERILFLIDVSASMQDLIGGATNAAGDPIRKAKFDRVQEELTTAVAGLSSNTRFNIVAFAADLEPWKKSAVAANSVNRASASSFIKRLKPLGAEENRALAAAGLSSSANLAAGRTNTFKALMFPFGIDPDEEPRARRRRSRSRLEGDYDTVFFLSDGHPSIGAVVDMREIQGIVRELNQVQQMVIHCIAIGDFQKTFMRDLARDSGGAFVDLGG